MSRDTSSWRTIPTHVGRTVYSDAGMRQHTDHPHARGENYRGLCYAVWENGPSPRTWGEPTGIIQGTHERRTIPTHVGRTLFRFSWPQRKPDHPHARGENRERQLGGIILRGPSPRTWGELAPILRQALRMRTIPTHVGRTGPEGTLALVFTDHPHARGENDFRLNVIGFKCGPSPRTWGEPCLSKDLAILFG